MKRDTPRANRPMHINSNRKWHGSPSPIVVGTSRISVDELAAVFWVQTDTVKRWTRVYQNCPRPTIEAGRWSFSPDAIGRILKAKGIPVRLVRNNRAASRKADAIPLDAMYVFRNKMILHAH